MAYVFTARCTIAQSAVLRLHVVNLSVGLSVCNVGGLGLHTGLRWKCWKLG